MGRSALKLEKCWQVYSCVFIKRKKCNILPSSPSDSHSGFYFPPKKTDLRDENWDLSREAENSYKRDICHIRMFSFVLTKLNQKERRVYDMSFFLVTRLLNSLICLFHTDSKRSLRPLPFLSRTGNVLYVFHLQSFWILTVIQENIPLHSCNLQGLHGPEPQACRLEAHWALPTQEWHSHSCGQQASACEVFL